MAASAILDFCICKFWSQIDAGALFSAYLSNSEQMCPIMAELWPKKWFSIWRPPPSWILSDMSSEGKSFPGTLFYISVSNLVQIRSKMAELLPFNWFQNGGRRHLGFLHYVNFDGKSVCGTPFSTSVLNSVQMHAIMAELWTKKWFSIWRPPPSWILSDTSSEGKSCPRTLSRCLHQIWCKSVHKWRSYGRLTDFKMAAAAILNCYFVTIDHPRSLLHGPNIVLKSCFNRTTIFRDISIWKFSKFGLKRLFPPPIFAFWGVLTHKHYFSSSRPSKGTSLGESASFKV